MPIDILAVSKVAHISARVTEHSCAFLMTATVRTRSALGCSRTTSETMSKAGSSGRRRGDSTPSA